MLFLLLTSALATDLVGEAVRPRGMGGVSRGTIVVLKEDTKVYRMWSGPIDPSLDGAEADAVTTEYGSWWTFDPPSGSVEQYRKKYAICSAWNDLTWISVCTLKAGAEVVVGPTQSVSERTCGVPGEEYRRTRAKQVYIHRSWERDDLICDLSYPADSTDLERVEED